MKYWAETIDGAVAFESRAETARGIERAARKAMAAAGASGPFDVTRRGVRGMARYKVRIGGEFRELGFPE